MTFYSKPTRELAMRSILLILIILLTGTPLSLHKVTWARRKSSRPAEEMLSAFADSN